MAPPPRTEYATYVIFFHDRDEYDFAVAAVGGTPATGGQFDGSPDTAAAFFGIPIPFPSGNMDLIPKGIYFNSVYTYPSYQANPFAPPNVFLLGNDDDGVVIPSYSSSFGQVGTPYTLKWRGSLVYMQGASPTTPTPTAIPRRRWIDGFEIQFQGSGGFSGSSTSMCRDASRTIDGLGTTVRGNSSQPNFSHRVNEHDGAFTTRKSWERFYIRLRNNPVTAFVGVWRCHNSASPAAGIALAVDTSGRFDLYRVSNISVVTLELQGPVLELMKWYKIDVVFQYPDGAGVPNGTALIFFDGVLVFNYSDSSGGGLDTIGFHTESDLGKSGIAALGNNEANIEADFDDWICSDWPENLGVLTLDSIDFLMGSHVRRTNNLTVSATNYTPAGGGQLTNNRANATEAINGSLVSTTASALIEGLTDLPLLGVQDKFGEVALGAVAAVIGVCSTNAGSTDGQLGYNAAGAGNVMITINELNAPVIWYFAAFRPSGLIVPAEITPFLIRYTKSADANSANIRALAASVEYIGIWGQEDVTDPTLFPEDTPRTDNLHNCLYPQTPWGFMGPTLEAFVWSTGFIYTGNGTQQDIVLPDLCHLIFIRPLSGASGGVKWFGAGLNGNNGTLGQLRPNYPVRVWFDSTTGETKMTVAGTDAQINQNAVQYQVIAFCDPGMRYCVTGAFNERSNNAEEIHSLQNPSLTPEFCFAQFQNPAATGLEAMWVRGPGNTGNAGNQLNNPGIAVDFGSFGLGTLTSRATLHSAQQSQLTFFACRSSDGCAYVMMQILSYTGDGTGSRVIPLTPTSNRFPLFVLVCPTSGGQAALCRDPSHAGANCARFDTLANVPANGITALGMDTITVGSLLNANGVVYNIFCLPGDTAGANNGVFFPASCDMPDPWVDPPLDPPEIAVMANGGLSFDGQVALTLLKDVTGIYTLIPNKTNDTLYDRQTGQPSVDVEIPDPTFKTGYIGG